VTKNEVLPNRKWFDVKKRRGVRVIYPDTPIALSLSPAFQGVSRDSKGEKLDRLPELLGTRPILNSRSERSVPWGGWLLQVQTPCNKSKLETSSIEQLRLEQALCQISHQRGFCRFLRECVFGKACK
jgi:hypothetical protein